MMQLLKLNKVQSNSFIALILTLTSTAILAATPFTTNGNFSVGSDGSANYNIPIQVPPGTAGMVPTLSLHYSSNGGNGILGMGWGLDGLSQISRCPKTIIQDGAIGGVNYDNNDKLCIDGQRLISTGGTYGAAGTEYRTESANFARIISYGTAGNGPASFKVWTKAGQIIEYGNTEDSRIEAAGIATARTWGVNKISDTKGNYINITYVEDNPNGETYVSRIDYTGNASSTPALTPYASVQFSYEARPDPSTGYHAGSVIKSTKRMTNIKTYSDTTLVKDYRLTYSNAATTIPMTRLQYIQECNDVSDCNQRITSQYPINVAVGTFAPLVYNQLSSTGYATPWQLQMADVNGDGKADAVGTYIGTSNSSGVYVSVALSKGDGTFSPLVYNQLSSTGYATPWQLQMADVNGDGKADAVGTYIGTSNSSGVYVASTMSMSANMAQVTNISPGLGSSINLSYKPITDNSVYAKDTLATTGSTVCPIVTGVYPIQDTQEPQYVVSTATVSDGNGGVLTNTYHYGGLKTHMTGRGSLGFRYQKVTQTDADTSSTTFFRQDYPYIGLPCQTEQRINSTNTLIGASQLSYGNTPLSTGSAVSQFPYLTQSVEQHFELDGSLINTTTTANQYDGYGNATRISVNSGDGYEKTTTNDYSNDTANWLLGRLLRSTVTSTTP